MNLYGARHTLAVRGMEKPTEQQGRRGGENKVAKPYIHAKSSVKRWGGEVSDYLPIHDFLDSSKGVIPDSRHRALTHTSWFLSFVLERVFGTTITNSDDKVVSVRDIGEQHILEDFGNRFIPSAQDYLQNIEWEDWMLNGKAGKPPSFARIPEKKGTVRTTRWDRD